MAWHISFAIRQSNILHLLSSTLWTVQVVTNPMLYRDSIPYHFIPELSHSAIGFWNTPSRRVMGAGECSVIYLSQSQR